MEVTGLRCSGAIAGGTKRSKVEVGVLSLRGTIAGGGERSKVERWLVEGSGLRWRGAV